MSTILAPLNSKQVHNSVNGNSNNNNLKRKLSSLTTDNYSENTDSIANKKSALLKPKLLQSAPLNDNSFIKTNGRKKSANVVRSKVHQVVYTPGETFLNVFPSGKQLKMFVGVKHLAAYLAESKVGNSDNNNANPKSDKRKIWGTDTYTCDSDIIAACHHSGKLKLEMIDSGTIEGVVASLRITDNPRIFVGSYQNSVQSEPLDAYSGKSFIIQDLAVINKMSQEEQDQHMKASKAKTNDNLEDRFLPNVTVVFNLSNEPRMKYTLNTVADRGFENRNYTSFRLIEDVLFVETHKERFELSRVAQLPSDSTKDTNANVLYRWARVRTPHIMDAHSLAKMDVPLTEERITVLYSDLRWEEIQWGTDSVCVRGTKYSIWNCQYHKRTDMSNSSNNTNSDGCKNEANTQLDCRRPESKNLDRFPQYNLESYEHNNLKHFD